MDERKIKKSLTIGEQRIFEIIPDQMMINLWLFM